MYEGELMEAHFVRQQEELIRLSKQEKRQLIFISGDGHVEQADLQIDISVDKFSHFYKLKNDWRRSWGVSVLKSNLINPKMGEMLSHLNNVRGYQLYKKSLDI